eukprot:383186-Prorocentrum_minimum.AAC.2
MVALQQAALERLREPPAPDQQYHLVCPHVAALAPVPALLLLRRLDELVGVGRVHQLWGGPGVDCRPAMWQSVGKGIFVSTVDVHQLLVARALEGRSSRAPPCGSSCLQRVKAKGA